MECCVEVRVNENADCNPKLNNGRRFFGWYHGPARSLVICQEVALNTNTFGQGQGEWSEEDLDTLRHEAHHLVQDCRDNELNQELNAVYTKPVVLALEVLGKARAKSIVESYSNRSEHIQVMELEAFAVAQLNNPLEQVQDIKTYCF